MNPQPSVKTYPSPFSVCLVIFAIMVASVAAPLIPFILIAAVFAQRRLNSGRREEELRIIARAENRRARLKAEGLRYFRP